MDLHQGDGVSRRYARLIVRECRYLYHRPSGRRPRRGVAGLLDRLKQATISANVDARETLERGKRHLEGGFLPFG